MHFVLVAIKMNCISAFSNFVRRTLAWAELKTFRKVSVRAQVQWKVFFTFLLIWFNLSLLFLLHLHPLMFLLTSDLCSKTTDFALSCAHSALLSILNGCQCKHRVVFQDYQKINVVPSTHALTPKTALCLKVNWLWRVLRAQNLRIKWFLSF